MQSSVCTAVLPVVVGMPLRESINDGMMWKRGTSCPARKPTVWPLRNVSTQIRLRCPRRLIRVDTFRLRGDRVMIPETENPQEAKSVYLGKPARHA